jgi:hypothetical protein
VVVVAVDVVVDDVVLVLVLDAGRRASDDVGEVVTGSDPQDATITTTNTAVMNETVREHMDEPPMLIACFRVGPSARAIGPRSRT